MRGEWKLAMKLPVQSTLHEPDSSNASDFVVAASATNGGPKNSDMMGKRVNDANTPPPLSSSPPTANATAATMRTVTVEVHPITIRKTPKFPSRDRHLAIRRKKATTSSAVDSVGHPLTDEGENYCCQCAVGEEEVLEGGPNESLLTGSGE